MSSLYSSINSGISGLNAQSMAMASSASNISNMQSIGYKGTKVAFKTMVSGAGEGTANSVLGYTMNSIAVNGEIMSDSYSTDTTMALEGQGMFAVNTKSDKTGSTYFTRNGTFEQDAFGNFQNSENVYLLAWKAGDESQDKVENLDIVNVANLAEEAMPTTNIKMSMNLDAGEKIASSGKIKASVTSTNNNHISVKNIIFPDNNLIQGDSFSVTVDNSPTQTFTYGGIARTAIASSGSSILGANDAKAKFSALNSGNKFIITTATSGDEIFSYSTSANAADGTFNSLSTLADAINYKGDYSARIVNNSLYISPTDANQEMIFRSITTGNLGKSNDISGVFEQQDPQISVMSKTFDTNSPIFGAANATDLFTGLTTNDQIIIRLADESQHTFAYSATPSAAAFTFNNFQSLVSAINNDSQLRASIIGNNQLKIDYVSNPILSIFSPGANNAAGTMGINVNSVFQGQSTVGDGIEIAFGSYDDVASLSKIDQNTKLSQITTITGRSITDLGGILGANVSTDVFTNVNDGETITINTSSDGSSVNVTFKANSPSASSSQFNSLATLVSAINNTGLNASIVGNAISITSKSGTKGLSISSSNPNIARELGIQFTAPKDNDQLIITLDSGDSATFTYKDVATTVDPSKNQFNNLATLQTAINTAMKNKINASIPNSSLLLMPSTVIKSSIKSITGNAANTLGIAVNSNPLSLKFTGNNSGTGASGAPNTSEGEFNDLYTLREAIAKSSKGLLNAKITDSGTKLSVSLKQAGSTGNIKYINDLNTSGNSNFATKMGLKNADIIAGLGIKNTDFGTNRFSTLEGLSTLLNNSSGIASTEQLNSIEISPENVLNGISFVNTSTNSGNLLSMLNLPETPITAFYSALDSTKNMASGHVKPSFFSDIDVFDSLGGSHNLRLSFLKTDVNSWAIELYANNIDDIITSRKDALLGTGNIQFNTDGLIENISFDPIEGNSNSGTFSAVWSNGSSAANIALDLGSPAIDSLANSGFSQYYADYNISTFHQDGSAIVNVNKVYISDDGYVNALFDNGMTKKLYRVPIAVFVSPNHLNLENGNLYTQTNTSGPYSLKKVGQNGAGNIITNAVEISNVDLSNELQNLMSINQMYQSCLKVIHSANFLIDELNKIIA